MGVILAVTTKAFMLIRGVRSAPFSAVSQFFVLCVMWKRVFFSPHPQMSQSVLGEHSHTMMLKHHPTNDLLLSPNPYFFGFFFCFLEE